MPVDRLRKDGVCAGLDTRGLRQSFAGMVLLVLIGSPLHAREIHIKVLNARSGKAITKDCVNVFIPGIVSALVIPTDKDGIARLLVEGGHAQPIKGRNGACNGFATLDPTVGVGDKIQVSSVFYVACQEYVNSRSVTSAIRSPTEELMPSYPVEKILQSGLTASNRCGKFRAEAKPGELILFVRPRSFWERLRE